MVVVRLDPSLYDVFIPPQKRARTARRGRPARGVQPRGAEKENPSLVWRVAEILQVLPATPTDEKSIHVHLYDTHDSHKDICDRKFHPAYRDTKNDKEVYDSQFKATVAKPQHFLEFKDTLPASSLLTRPFTLRKDGALPRHVIEQLLPHLVIRAIL